MKTKNKQQDAKVRVNNFLEVESTYTDEEAKKESQRCLQCKVPYCVKGCPVKINIPLFIRYILEEDNDKSLEEIRKTSNLPAVCGRVCPQEKQCEKNCIVGKKDEPVAIGKLERYAAEKGDVDVSGLKKRFYDEKNSKVKVGVIGSGPASLTCAGDLSLRGFDVTMFEALHDGGGVLAFGIPEFRLPKKIVKEELENTEKLGVKIKYNHVIGRIKTLKEVESEFDYIFIGSGAGLPKFMNIPGEDLGGVFSANEFLTRVNLMKAYDSKYDTPIKKADRTIVIGGGNVALDAARVALRLGAKVSIAYRRTRDEMPARAEEIEHAHEEGVEFKFLYNPIEIIAGDGDNNKFVKCVEFQKMELSEKDESGRRRPVPIPGETEIIEADQVIIAIGNGPNPILLKGTGLELTNKGKLKVNENNQTSNPKIFAGGDIIEGDVTVIKAMGDGKIAAEAIVDISRGKNLDR